MEITSLTGTGRALFGFLSRKFIGNHLAESEMTVALEASDAYLIQPQVMWKFEPVVTTETVKGNGAVEGRHFGYHNSEFDTKIQAIALEAVRGTLIRQPFIGRMIASGIESLSISSHPQPVYDFGSYSAHRKCSGCNGRGLVTCHGCGGGRNNCLACGGAGTQNTPVTKTHYHNGQSHTTTNYENRLCAGCGGVGKVNCRDD
jgi:hypothetical protein